MLLVYQIISLQNMRDQNNMRSKFYLSLAVCYLTAFFFGFHLTGIEMIRKFYFKTNEKLVQKYYYIAAILFAVPIFGGIFRSFIFLNIPQWFCIIHSSHLAAFLLYMTGYIQLFYVARFFAGFGMGLSSSVVPEYVGKLAPERRGFLTYLFQTYILVGVLTGQICTILSTKIVFMNSFYGIAACTALIAAICTFVIILPEEDDIKNSRSNETHKTLLDLLKDNKSKKSIMIALLTHVTQQMTCIKAVLTYSNTLFERSSPGSAQKKTILVGFFSLVITYFTSFIIERVGRKILVQLSTIVVCVSLWILIKDYNPLFALILFQFGYSFGLGPVTWLLTSEIFPIEYQPVAVPICGIINWFCATMTVLFFEKWIKAYGAQILYINIAILLVVACMMQVLLKETRGRPAKFQ
ncbi:Major Facilitator Superfamily (MFS) [Pseudoloma neurophilia]|uniref:Major Facilitator Superfamily (MFS) n=1 Tax=Pseudoloma neurophilia TaxID=146866 RepID=A0A0R0LV39_9MICR|nr:Major Facilitator Superfamily (MFS) [Pseudoloma neurophilia]